jgi:hypothetical protein
VAPPTLFHLEGTPPQRASPAPRRESRSAPILTDLSFDLSPTVCYGGCGAMIERYMYDAVRRAAGVRRPARGLFVTRHFFTLSGLERLIRPLRTDFLTGTPKRIESALTHTKQSTEALPNRDTNTTPKTFNVAHLFRGEAVRPRPANLLPKIDRPAHRAYTVASRTDRSPEATKEKPSWTNP